MRFALAVIETLLESGAPTIGVPRLRLIRSWPHYT